MCIFLLFTQHKKNYYNIKYEMKISYHSYYSYSFPHFYSVSISFLLFFGKIYLRTSTYENENLSNIRNFLFFFVSSKIYVNLKLLEKYNLCSFVLNSLSNRIWYDSSFFFIPIMWNFCESIWNRRNWVLSWEKSNLNMILLLFLSVDFSIFLNYIFLLISELFFSFFLVW